MRILGVSLLVGVWVFACNGDDAATTAPIPTEAGDEPTVDSGEPPQPGLPDATVLADASDDAGNVPILGDATDAGDADETGEGGFDYIWPACELDAGSATYQHQGDPNWAQCSPSAAVTWKQNLPCDDECPLWWGCEPYEEAKQALSVCADAGVLGVLQGRAGEGCGYLILEGTRRDPSWGVYEPDTGELVATWVVDDVGTTACSGEVPMECVGWDPFAPSPLPMVDLCAGDAGPGVDAGDGG